VMYRDTENQRPMSPQLALRVAIIGGVALVMFAIIFFRLWYLQVLSGDKYLAEANNNRVREIKLDAPRGKILDTNGEVLVDNKPGNAVKIDPSKLPRDPHEKALVYARLSRTLGINRRELRRSVTDQLNQQPFSTATVKSDVNIDVIGFLRERASQFPGVTVEQVQFRSYPKKELAAQILGYVGQVSEKALKEKLYPGTKQGDRVGIAGIESSYDRFLRGKNGATRVQVDSLGEPHGQLSTREPVPGQNLKLTLDAAVQKTGQQALGQRKGGFVVMDVKTGAIKALGSTPSYDPNVFSKVLKNSDFQRLSSDANGAPLLNRATTGQYPTGSVFKLVTSVAALESGLITATQPIQDNGKITVGTQEFKNSGGGTPHGTLAMRKALQVSSDVYYYLLGQGDNGHFQIQKWARKLGFGKPTGIDVPGEGYGLVPTEKWVNKNSKRLGVTWTVGQNIQLAIGQGFLLADPLQVAVAYAAVGNGGYIVKPHLAQRIEDADGAAVQEFGNPARKKLDINPAYRQTIMEGLHDAADAPGGTSYPVFANFPVPVAGKTGTAERLGQPDQSWYSVLAPYPNPKYVVTVTVEAGGFGADSAAPAACKVLSTLLHVSKKGACTGNSPTDAAKIAKAN
jgi:penicillin-binding protein 2